MIETLIIENDMQAVCTLETLLSDNCPHISICGKSISYNNALEKIEEIQPDLVFLQIDVKDHNIKYVFDIFNPFNCEIIITSSTDEHAFVTLSYGVSGYLLKPIKKSELIKAVNNASKRIRDKRRRKTYDSKVNNNIDLSKEVIGIPTIDGYEFVSVRDIVRCEGMKKCTRIITIEKSDLISSYNIGEFRKLLNRFGFYSPHKSHLINLNMIQKYHKEGNLLMANGSWVPVAKRRKKEFLKTVQHI